LEQPENGKPAEERRRQERRKQERRQQQRRKHERRLRTVRFFVIERRKGDLWKYGSIVLALALLAIVSWLLRR
jgi:ribosomal protein L9